MPPAGQGYSSITTSVSVSLNWPYNYAGTGFVLTKILDISCAVGNTLTLPPANQVSTGEDAVIRNVGSQALTVLNASGGNVTSIPAGVALYLWVIDNSTVAGSWGQVTFGAGSASISAGAIAGLGLTAIAATLNAATPVFATAGNYVVTATDRAELIEFNAGAAVLTLPAVATAGNNFLFYVKNGGAGVVAVTPQSGEMIDNQATLGLQPNESAMVVCSGTAWFTVGYGRSILYQFSQLVLDVSAGGTFTLNATQASNKLLTFVGNPAGNVTVVVPNVVAIYYIQSNLSTAHNVTVKTSAGTGVVVPQSGRTVAIDDGTNVSAAVSVTSTTNLALTDGTVSAPSLSFASQTNTGIYKLGSTGFGIAVAGIAALDVTPTGVEAHGTLQADGVLTAAVGATITTGGLTVSAGGITSTGATSLTGALNVTGTTTLTGNEAISGTLNVTGTATLAAVTAVGALNVTGNVGVTGNEAVSGTLNVTGATSLVNLSATGTLNVSGTGVVVGAGAGTAVAYIAPGTVGNVLTNVAGVWASAPATTVDTSVVGTTRNGKCSVTSASATATYTADEVIVVTALNGTGVRLASFSQSVNLATTGAGGMDTGSPPNNGFISLYAIAQAAGASPALLACAVATSSGSVYSGANIPASYTMSALVAVLPIDNTGKIKASLTLDRSFWYDVVQAIFSAVASGASLTSRSLSTAVPAVAKTASGMLGTQTTAQGNAAQFAGSVNGLGGVAVACLSLGSNVSNFTGTVYAGIYSFQGIPMQTSQTIYWATGGAGGGSYDMYVTGYTF